MRRLGAPVILRGFVQESAANTYTERELNMPLGYPVDEKGRAFELCRILSDCELPDLAAPGRVNYRITQHNQAAILEIAHQDVIWGKSLVYSEEGTEHGVYVVETANDDLTCDGQGIIIARPKIWLQVLGVGNGAGKDMFVQLHGYIVELDPEEFLTLKAHDRLDHPVQVTS